MTVTLLSLKNFCFRIMISRKRMCTFLLPSRKSIRISGGMEKSRNGSTLHLTKPIMIFYMWSCCAAVVLQTMILFFITWKRVILPFMLLVGSRLGAIVVWEKMENLIFIATETAQKCHRLSYSGCLPKPFPAKPIPCHYLFTPIPVAGTGQPPTCGWCL